MLSSAFIQFKRIHHVQHILSPPPAAPDKYRTTPAGKNIYRQYGAAESLPSVARCACY